MKRVSYFKKSVSTILFAMMLLATSLLSSVPVAADSGLNLKSSVNSKYQVTIKWKKKSVSKYIIYRKTFSFKKGDWGNDKKLASISGKRTSYLDKKITKKNLYMYTIKAYKGKKLKYTDYTITCAGLGHCYWSDYFSTEGSVSPTKIELACDVYPGMKPDGFQIYRAPVGGKYKLIKTLKIKKYSMKYTDKTVKAGTHYKYKIRAYKKIKNKKIYGPYTEAINKNAVNYTALYKTQVICPQKDGNGMVPYITLKLIPTNAYNGDLTLDHMTCGTLLFGDDTVNNYNDAQLDDLDCTQYTATLYASAYSYDGANWINLKEKATQIPGAKTVFIKLEHKKYIRDEVTHEFTNDMKVEPFKYNLSDYEGAAFAGFDIRYNTNIPTYMAINLKTGHTYMSFNYEAIH